MCADHISKKHFVKLDMYQKPYTCCINCEPRVGCILWTNFCIPLSVVAALVIVLVILVAVYA